MGRQIGQGNRGAHENNGGQGSNLVQQRQGAFGAEQRLAGTAERCSDVRTFSVLQQDDADQEEANDNMNNDDNCGH